MTSLPDKQSVRFNPRSLFQPENEKSCLSSKMSSPGALKRLFAFYSITLTLSTLSANVAVGQSPPDGRYFLVDLSLTSQPVQVGKPVNITQRKGYDNQPSFTAGW